MKHFLSLVFINILFLPCKDNFKSEVKNNISKVKGSFTQNINIEKIIIDKEHHKVNVSKSNVTFDGFEIIFNHKLTGLSIVNKNARDPFKKYGLDFSTVCMCNSPSLYINQNSKKLFVFNYCDSDISLNNIEKKIILKIIKIEKQNDKIILFTEPNLKIIFERIGKFSIFEIQVIGVFPKEYVGSDLKSIFTSEPEKFQKEDCGDFDG